MSPRRNRPFRYSRAPRRRRVESVAAVHPGEALPRHLEVPPAISVQGLAGLMGVSPVDVIKELIKNGIMANINQVVDYETAKAVALGLGYEVGEAPVPQADVDRARPGRFAEEDAAKQQLRPPVVTIMGHVDHGKTSLLDAIRETNVIATEAGGITQHIGAYQVEVRGGRITFLDTPGHEAFTAMRARGAHVTDIAVLVVAADDGVMPQTVEAIDHARAANVPIVVAINKIDKADANPERVKQQLVDRGLLIEEWGGDVICVPVSAKKKEGISDLLENILVVAEISELKANPDRLAEGAVIEAKMDSTRGPLATVLVQTGTLQVGDCVVVGDTWGRVKAMFNDKGKRVKRAEPSTPTEIMGLNSVPQAGDTFRVVPSEKEARAEVEQRQREKEAASLKATRPINLDEVSHQAREGQIKELNIIVKADVQGSVEAIRGSLERLSTDKVRVRIIHASTGSISDTDVMLAVASKAIIIGFNTRPTLGAVQVADIEGVDIRPYEIIYNLVDDIEKALAGLLEPVFTEVLEGRAQVRAVFTASKIGKVAGSYVSDGRVSRGAMARVMRDGQVIYDSKIASLRRFKDDVREIPAGLECGISLEGYHDFQVGDIIEVYRKERVRQSL